MYITLVVTTKSSEISFSKKWSRPPDRKVLINAFARIAAIDNNNYLITIDNSINR